MKHESRVIVQEQPFDFTKEYSRLKSASMEVGAVSVFIGTVRDLNDGNEVVGLKLEHYPGMTEKEVSKIIDEADERWDIITATVIHRIGHLAPGDEIVFVGVSSQHRSDAFQACEFIMDYLKTKATIWKKETVVEGERWLKARQSDIDVADRWRIIDSAD